MTLIYKICLTFCYKLRIYIYIYHIEKNSGEENIVENKVSRINSYIFYTTLIKIIYY